MTDHEKLLRELVETLQEATEGMSQLEKALFISRTFRDACGGEWRITVDGDRWSITETENPKTT